jgi:hypothetical protein
MWCGGQVGLALVDVIICLQQLLETGGGDQRQIFGEIHINGFPGWEDHDD